MDTYVKIDRASGAVLSREGKDNPVRALNKPAVSLKQIVAPKPEFDPATQKLVQQEGPSADVSDLTQPVPESVTWNITWGVVALSIEELAAKRRANLAATDGGIVRGVEDLLVALIGKAVIAKTDVPAELVDKINARRALRGEARI